jgi:hypothetical protein
MVVAVLEDSVWCAALGSMLRMRMRNGGEPVEGDQERRARRRRWRDVADSSWGNDYVG